MAIIKLQYHRCYPLWMKIEDWAPCPFFSFSDWGSFGFVIKIWRFRIIIRGRK